MCSSCENRMSFHRFLYYPKTPGSEICVQASTYHNTIIKNFISHRGDLSLVLEGRSTDQISPHAFNIFFNLTIGISLFNFHLHRFSHGDPTYIGMDVQANYSNLYTPTIQDLKNVGLAVLINIRRQKKVDTQEAIKRRIQ